MWAGLINGNDDQALKGIRALGLGDHFLDILGLVMVYRVPQSVLDSGSQLAHRKHGLLNSNEYKHVVMEHIREKFGADVTLMLFRVDLVVSKIDVRDGTTDGRTI